ncbi:MAG: hypothetical protein IKF72_10050 [Kiritimatiellae bacterium]|nr:hypothetical protein [Kiritimatiellia bacterium]
MLEFRRVVATTWNRGLWRTVFEFVVLPLMVAFIMVSSFLARSKPDAQGEAFLFFGTIYAFWCGLFGTCQAFNGEVNSGEWSYWMLGLHRGVVRHCIAHFAAGFFFAMLQVGISLLFLWCLWKIGAVVKPLGLIFVAPDYGLSFINQFGSMLKGGTAYNLQGLSAAMNAANHAGGTDNVLWFITCSGFYLGAVAMAVASGVSIGLLVSAICPTPHVSQNVAVLLIVACCICSHTGTVGFGGDARAEREFAPIDLIIRQKGRQYQDAKTYEGLPIKKRRQTQWKDGGTVEQLSFVLPQRYFFNIARIPCLKLESSLGYDDEMRPWHNPERLSEHAKNAADFCKCPVCIDLVTVTETNGEYVVGWDGKDCILKHHWIRGENSAGNWKMNVLVKREGEDEKELCGDFVKFRQALYEDVGGVGSLIAFCRRMATVEAVALFFWCAICAGITVVLLTTRRQFNELR